MILTTWQNELRTKSPADNERFCEMAAVAPQKRQCELGSYYPAASVVKPPPRKAAGRCTQAGQQKTKIKKYGL